jgi:uncharacterized membrane protein YebE (DUF533 family)
MNLNRIFNGLMSSGVAGGMAGGAASALLVQGLTSKKGRKMAGSAVKLGGAAVIGGLAWNAYQNYRSQNPAQGDSRSSGLAENARGGERWDGIPEDQFLPRDSAPAARRDLLVLRAMITAAHADGHIDGGERLHIFDRIEKLDLSHAEKGLLLEEVSSPLDVQQLVQQVPSRALAAEVYAAALLVADTPSPAHRLFLQDLAEQLALPAAFVKSLHDEVEHPQAAALDFEARDAGATVSPQA